MVQGILCAWLAGPMSVFQSVTLLGGGALVLATGAWLIGVRRRPLVRLLGRVERLAVGQVAEDVVMQQLASSRGPEGRLTEAVLAVQRRVSNALNETRTLRTQAEEAGVYRTAFLKAVAHELRTPLNAILGFTDVLLSGIEGPLSDDRKENLQVLRESAQRLLSLFNDAIELSTMASGQLSLRRERVEVRALLEEAVTEIREHLKQDAASRPVIFSVEVTCSGAMVAVQKDRLLRVLDILGAHCVNRLAANAVRFVATDLGKSVAIEVYDDGNLFGESQPSKLFAPQQATDSESRRDALRLSIARQLATLHGGSLDAFAKQSGPRFVLELPRAAAEVEHA